MFWIILAIYIVIGFVLVLYTEAYKDGFGVCVKITLGWSIMFVFLIYIFCLILYLKLTTKNEKDYEN